MRKTVWIQSLPVGYRVRHWKAIGVDPLTKKTKYEIAGDYFKDYNLAQKKRAELKLSLLAKQQGIMDPTISPSSCFDSYVRYMESRPDEFRQSTIGMKKEALEEYLKTIPEMTGLSPKAFLAYMDGKEYNITTKSIRLRNLRAFCYWCQGEGYLQTNPFIIKSADGKQYKFKIPKGRERGRKLELEEISAILNAADERAKLYLVFIATHGSRRLETLKVDWKDISLHDQTWTIPALNVKTKRDRVIPISDMAYALLKEVPKDKQTGPLFPGFNPRTPRWYIIKACKKAGIKPDAEGKYPTPHDFKHSFVSHWSGDPRILMEMVDWTSLEMLKRYSHFTRGQLVQAMKQTGVGAKLEKLEGDVKKCS